jgi:hypothetical protein
VHVDAVGVQREAVIGGLFIIDRYQNQINIGFVPDCVVRQAAA